MPVPSSPPQALKVDLVYYDGHATLLAKGAYAAVNTAAKVAAFQGTIPLADFLNYFLIHRAKSPLYATYAARNERLDQVITWLDGVITTNGTVNCQAGSDNLQMMVGESLSLAVVSSLFGLTAADWNTIPVKQFKAFDFERTMMGITPANAIVQVEAKGSFVDDNTIKQHKVADHASSIAKKKGAIAKAGANYPYPATVRYGVIASVDSHNTAKCFLLDPPGDHLDGDPRSHRIANRLEHLAMIVSLLAPKAKLPAALVKRAAAWRQSRGSVPTGVLQTPMGHAFTSGYYVEDFLANGKVWLEKMDIVGQLYRRDSKQPFFLGLRGNAVRTAIGQDPEAIVQERFEPSSESVEVTGQPVLVTLRSLTRGESSRSRMTLHTASSGVVFGLPAQE